MKRVAYLFLSGFVVIITVFSCNSPSLLSRPTIKILVLGNSITHHAPAESLGWSGDWGMAASARDKDFLHVLIDSLEKHNQYRGISYKENNIAHWEQNFDHDFSKDSLRFYKPDILIIRLGENVPEEYARNNNFEKAISTLVETFKSENTHTIITGNFWPSVYKDSIQEKVAINNGYASADLSDLQQNDANKALGQFGHPAVAEHPSDTGMNNIAVKIYKRILYEKWF